MNELKKYLKEVDGVSHITFDPYGPGSCRVHLIPPKKLKIGVPWVLILNGYDVIPVSTSWAVIIREFIKASEAYDGVLNDDQAQGLLTETVKRVKKIFPKTDSPVIRRDLKSIIVTIMDLAKGKTPNEEIGYLTLKEYAKYMSAPHRMDLMVSSMVKDQKWHCNQKCMHCYACGASLAQTEELPTKQWCEIIDKLKAAQISQVTFTGGEPTLRDDLVELVKHASWFVTRLNTNGIKLTPSLCENLKEASLDACQVTLYSYDEDIHNKLVGGPHFKETIEGIKNAVKAGLNVSINTPICSLNKDYKKTLEFAKDLGITFFSCSGLIMTGNSKEQTETYLTKKQMFEVLKEATNYAYDNELDVLFTSPGWLNKEDYDTLKLHIPSCGACLSNMAIAPNGEVIPCQSYLDNESLGNILKESFKTIWNKPQTKKIRKLSSKSNDKCLLALKEVE